MIPAIMESLIQPRILKGFRDSLPEAEIRRAGLIEILTRSFRAAGFVPIDTPALEYAEILLRKSSGETEKQIFRFQDNGARDVALRFDLTVPLARFIAEHRDKLSFPFKRYHIAKVWRGEKPQAGRYREFMQCDFDIVGSDTVSSDFDIAVLMKTALESIGAGAVKIRLNHRGLFNRFLQKLGLSDCSEDLLRAVDRLAKDGREAVRAQLEAITGSKTAADEIQAYISGGDGFSGTLALMEELSGGASAESDRLRALYGLLCDAGIDAHYILDPSITRGLDYYTGIVFETFLDALPEIGSVCSGGRYDNLTSFYMKERVSGVGASIGLDRLITALETLGSTGMGGAYLDAEILCLPGSSVSSLHELARSLRARSVSCEVFPEPKKTGFQYAYAEKKGIPFAVSLSGSQGMEGGISVKRLKDRVQKEGLSIEEAVAFIKGTAQS